MKEKYIHKKILDYINSLDRAFAWKEFGGMYSAAGRLDITCCYDGRFYAFEVKVPGNKATALQLSVIKKIRAASGVAEVVYSVEDVKKILERRES